MANLLYFNIAAGLNKLLFIKKAALDGTLHGFLVRSRIGVVIATERSTGGTLVFIIQVKIQNPIFTIVTCGVTSREASNYYEHSKNQSGLPKRECGLHKKGVTNKKGSEGKIPGALGTI